MKKITQHSGIAVPYMIDNVDTDQIIPSREMKCAGRADLSAALFANFRYRIKDGERIAPEPQFVLNLERFAGASILLGGKNFGCGSSREHAVWALFDFGFRVVIAESFGRIFQSNCARNGLLAIVLPEQQIAVIADQVRESPQTNQVLVDLEHGEIHTPANDIFKFEIAASDRHMLLHGLDHIEYTLQHDDAIRAFAASDRQARPWAYLPYPVE